MQPLQRIIQTAKTGKSLSFGQTFNGEIDLTERPAKKKRKQGNKETRKQGKNKTIKQRNNKTSEQINKETRKQ